MSRSNSSKPAVNKGEVPPGDGNSFVQQPLARPELVAFVIMPSGLHDEYVGGADEAEFVYEHIIKRGVAIASERLGRPIRVQRELDNRAAGSITADIVKRTAVADIAIVDITGMNPNVFFELGVRYAIRDSTTILMRKEDVRIPFDIAVYRAISYKQFTFDRAAKQLADAIEHSLSSEHVVRDSLVFDVFPDMEVKIPGVYESSTNLDRRRGSMMTWRELWQRLEKVVDTLRNVVQDGRYVPDVLLGISNGGLLVADVLGRMLFTHQPKLSLWADRAKGIGMFDNMYNVSLVETLLKCKPDSEKLEVLLVDDIVASGQTIQLARNFLESRLKQKATIRFLPICSRNEQYRDLIKGFLLYEDSRIPVNETQIAKLMATDHTSLPYHKEIRSS